MGVETKPSHVTMPRDVPEDGGAQNFGDIFRRLRNTQGLTVSEIAERAGVKTYVIERVDRGDTKAPHNTTLQGIIEAFELDINSPDALLLLTKTKEARKTIQTKPRRAIDWEEKMLTVNIDGNQVRQNRTEAGLTQKELAEMINRSPQFISDVELLNPRNCHTSWKSVLKFSIALDLPLETLVTDETHLGFIEQLIDKFPEKVAKLQEEIFPPTSIKE